MLKIGDILIVEPDRIVKVINIYNVADEGEYFSWVSLNWEAPSPIPCLCSEFERSENLRHATETEILLYG